MLVPIALMFVGVNGLLAQRSPYNHLSLVPPDSAGHYRLVFSGHFHGSSGNASGYPAATLLARLDLINETRANAIVSTGDLFLDPDRDSARYRTALFERLSIPLFNAPGNHDKEGRAYTDVRYPQLLRLGPDLVIVLDSELADSDIEGAQLDALKRVADEAVQGRLRRVFVVSHRPVWAEEDPVYGPLFKGNTRSLTGCNFKSEVLPVLDRISGTTEVFWVSGSMAGGAPSSVFFQPHASNLTYIQTAIRDELRDALLVADVSPQGITWAALSLTGEPTLAVERYNADWWSRSKGATRKGFQWRLLPYLVRTTVTDMAFWWGCGAMALVLLALRWLGRRWL
jgi:hypothetical protein